MKASLVIQHLQQLINQHGDLDVKMEDGDQILESVENVSPVRPFQRIEEYPYVNFKQDSNQEPWCFEISF